MRSSIFFRQTILAILVFTFTSSHAQTNEERIKAKWIVERFELEKNTPQAIRAQKDLEGMKLTFGNGELVLSKKTETGDTIIKKGAYSITGNLISLGRDQAEILFVSEDLLSLNISGQGILYLKKLL